MNIQQKIGLAIISLRRSQGLSQEEFARYAGIERCYMSSIENGKRQISITILERIATALELTPSQLLSEAERYS